MVTKILVGYLQCEQVTKMPENIKIVYFKMRLKHRFDEILDAFEKDTIDYKQMINSMATYSKSLDKNYNTPINFKALTKALLWFWKALREAVDFTKEEGNSNEVANRIAKPKATLHQIFAIRCALEVCTEQFFVDWANRWLNTGEFRRNVLLDFKSYYAATNSALYMLCWMVIVYHWPGPLLYRLILIWIT